MRYSFICGLGVLILFLKGSKCGEFEIRKPMCREKEKCLTFLNIAEDLVFNTKALCPKRKDTSDETEQSGCTRKEKYSTKYVKLIRKLLREIREDFPSCPSTNCGQRPRDCADAMAAGSAKSGIYTVFPMSKYTWLKAVKVYCDMDTDGGGWTVIQRRGNFTPQEDFYRSWEDYKVGFGNISRDFWLGNDNIYALSHQKPVELRIELADVGGNRRYAAYSEFRLDDEEKEYTLRVKNYAGDAGDAMTNHSGLAFYTKDRGITEAVAEMKGAWWINVDWAYSHLNGLYLPGQDSHRSAHWYNWQKNIGLASTEMKVRPVKSS